MDHRCANKYHRANEYQGQIMQNPFLTYLQNLGRISVFGYGVTSKPLVKWLNTQGIACDIYDDKFDRANPTKLANPACKNKSRDEMRDGLNTFAPPSKFDPSTSKLEFISPGIAPHHRYFSKALHIISEYDFVDRLLDSSADSNAESSLDSGDCDLDSQSLQTKVPQTKTPQIIWISGTNGKTTTTQMLSLLLEDKGAKAGGNIGTPLIELYEEGAKIWILETSSFAMHWSKVAKPQIYILLPIREDHISWHGSFEAYIDDKLNVLVRMEAESSAILPLELQNHRFVKAFRGKAVFYAGSCDLERFLGLESESSTDSNTKSNLAESNLDSSLKSCLDSNLDSSAGSNTKLKISFGEPFLLDGLLALCAQKILCNTYDIAKLNTFHIGAHRIEEFLDSYGYIWVDDSKGTNTDATLQAIKRYEGKSLYIVLGGDDKGADCEEIFQLLQSRQNASQNTQKIEASQAHNQDNHPCQAQKQKVITHIFTIGTNEPKLLHFAQKYHIKATACENLKNAVIQIKSQIKQDSTSKDEFIGLLSPAAASLDQFASYKERGKLFKRYVLED